MQQSIRIEMGGLTFRLFSKESDAIGNANLLTKQMDAQFNAMPVKGAGGFLVASTPKQEIHDAAGLLPKRAMLLLKNKGSYFEWSSKSIELPSQTATDITVSDRELNHHFRYLGTTGFKNADGSTRVPTPEEVVEHGLEPASYLVDPIPSDPRSGLCGVGRSGFLNVSTQESPINKKSVMVIASLEEPVERESSAETLPPGNPAGLCVGDTATLSRDFVIAKSGRIIPAATKVIVRVITPLPSTYRATFEPVGVDGLTGEYFEIQLPLLAKN